METIRSVMKNLKSKDLDLQYEIPKCPVCGEFIGKVVEMPFGTRIYPRMCKCRREKVKKEEIKFRNREKQIRLERIIKNSMMNNKFKKMTIENWDHNIGNEKLYRIAKKYIEKFSQMKKQNQGILLYGAPGNGKTYFSACIANELLNRLIPVVCVGTIALLERISQSQKTWGDEGLFTVLNTLENADLLILDDLGTEVDNKWTRAMIYQIIEKRNNTELPIIITTNMSIEELRNRYDERTYSRLTQMCSFIKNTGRDIRKIKGKNKTSEFLSELLKE